MFEVDVKNMMKGRRRVGEGEEEEEHQLGFGVPMVSHFTISSVVWKWDVKILRVFRSRRGGHFGSSPLILYYFALYYTICNWTALYCIVLYCFVLHCTVLFNTIRYC